MHNKLTTLILPMSVTSEATLKHCFWIFD